MYTAYAAGRSEKDPSQGWYKGELWFYDNYVIPLAKKLDECKVFGVASDECLNYAINNRKEWETKGESHPLRRHPLNGNLPKVLRRDPYKKNGPSSNRNQP